MMSGAHCAMTHGTQREFGTRHHKPKPLSADGDAAEDAWHIDWKLVALIAAVFVIAFVWLF
ncbi:MAG TPA: hypothetical protein VFD26_04275 [Methyloceanibacter sp.]|nr:hypothetical protein [Methyloceanibacter sp.]